MSEMAVTADRLIIIGRGRLIAETTVENFLNDSSGNFVRARSPEAGALASVLEARGAAVVRLAEDTLHITGVTTDAVGEAVNANGWTVQELSAHHTSLEQRYMQLTRGAAEFHTAEPDQLAPAGN